MHTYLHEPTLQARIDDTLAEGDTIVDWLEKLSARAEKADARQDRLDSTAGRTIKGVNPLARKRTLATLADVGQLQGTAVADGRGTTPDPDYASAFWKVRLFACLFEDEPGLHDLTERVWLMLGGYPTWGYGDVASILSADVTPPIEDVYAKARILRNTDSMRQANEVNGTVRSDTLRAVAEVLSLAEWAEVVKSAEEQRTRAQWWDVIAQCRATGMTRDDVVRQYRGTLPLRTIRAYYTEAGAT